MNWKYYFLPPHFHLLNVKTPQFLNFLLLEIKKLHHYSYYIIIAITGHRSSHLKLSLKIYVPDKAGKVILKFLWRSSSLVMFKTGDLELHGLYLFFKKFMVAFSKKTSRLNLLNLNLKKCNKGKKQLRTTKRW